MRVLVVGVLVMVAVASTGCFRYVDVIGCSGGADWTEPGIFEWVEENGFRR